MWSFGMSRLRMFLIFVQRRGSLYSFPVKYAARCLYCMLVSWSGLWVLAGVVCASASRMLMSWGITARTGVPVASSISSVVNSNFFP